MKPASEPMLIKKMYIRGLETKKRIIKFLYHLGILQGSYYKSLKAWKNILINFRPSNFIEKDNKRRSL